MDERSAVFEALVNLSSEIAYVYDFARQRVVSCNTAIASVLGYTPETAQALDSQGLASHAHPEDLGLYIANVVPRYAGLADGEVLERSLRVRRADGSWSWLEVRERVHARDDRGRPSLLVGMARDATAWHNLQLEQHRNHDLVEMLEVGLIQFDRQGQVVQANPAGCHLLGLPPDAGFPFDPTWSLVDADGRTLSEAEHPAVRSIQFRETLLGVEVGLRWQDRRERWLRVNSQPLYGGGPDSPTGALLTAVDTTEAHFVQRLTKLRLDLREFALSHRLDDLMQWTLDQAEKVTQSQIGFFHLIDTDEQTLELTAWSTNTLQTMCTAEGKGSHYHASQAGVWVQALNERRPVIHNDYPGLPNKRGLPKGHAPVLRELVVPVFNEGKIVALIGLGNRPWPYGPEDVSLLENFLAYFWDVLMQKRSEKLLLQKNYGLESSLNAVAFADLAGNLTYVNQAFVELWDLGGKADALGTPVSAYWQNPDRAAEVVERLGATGSWRGDLVAQRRNREALTLDVSANLVHDTDGQVSGSMATFVDITSRRRAEKQLAEQREHLRAVTENLPDVLLLADRDGRVTYVNHVTPPLTVEKVLGTSIESWADGDHSATLRAALGRAVVEHQASEFEALVRSSPGDPIPYHIKVAPIVVDGAVASVIFLGRDVRDLHRLIEATQNTQRLESLGHLAAGIAHDFNNLLAGIYGNVSMAELVSDSESAHSYLTRAVSTLDRAKALTAQLLTFAKGGEPVKTVVAIPALVKGVVEFTLSGTATKAHFQFEADLPPCQVDANQLGQVLTNLALNASQAAEGRGNLTVMGRHVDPWVELRFQDDGPGIPADILPHIFDPFFTTKPSGNGLGLTSSHSIVRRHGGSLTAENVEGGGACFVLRLLATTLPLTDSAKPTPESRVPGNSRRVLVLDDEAAIRDVLKAMLAALGYESDAFAEGAEAAKAWRKARANAPYMAGLLDLTVPGGLGGVETARTILADDPGARLYVASGYSADPVMAAPQKFGFRGSLSKPFLPRELATLLAEATDRR